MSRTIRGRCPPLSRRPRAPGARSLSARRLLRIGRPHGAGLAVYERSACRLPSLSQTGGCPSVHASPGRSPNQGRRAGFREHRPALGEISPFGCEILRVRAQRPCLGGLWPEQGPCLGEGQKRVSCLPAALSSVRTLQTDASLPRRDDVQESQCFAGGKAPILPSKDDVQDGVDQRPGLGELRPSGGNISRACARRPGLGEIFEQSPGLGELWASDARRATRGSRVLPAGCPFRGPQCSKMQEVSFLRLCMRYSACMNARLTRN